MLTPLRFSSNIRFVTSTEFHALPLTAMSQNEEYAAYPWRPRNRVRLKPRGYTDYAHTCNAGGISNQGKVSLFHLASSANLLAPDKVRESILEDLAQLQAEGKAVRAFLTGGVSDDGPSEQLFRMLKGLFETLNIPCSVLWGKRGNNPLNLYYSAPDDTWLVYTLKTDKAGKVQSGPISSLQDIQDTFARIHIEEGDTVEVGGKRYRPAEIASTERPNR